MIRGAFSSRYYRYLFAFLLISHLNPFYKNNAATTSRLSRGVQAETLAWFARYRWLLFLAAVPALILIVPLVALFFALRYKLARMKPEYIDEFPSVESADADGVVCIGGHCDAATYEEAFRRGIFPWPPSVGTKVMTWFCLKERTVLKIADLHISKTMEQFMRKHSKLTVSFDTEFEKVLNNCRFRPARKNMSEGDKTLTWINDEIAQAYLDLHKKGVCHSLEVRDETGEMIAGLFYTKIGTAVSMDSGFTKITSGGNYIVIELAKKVREFGGTWIDLKAPSDYLLKLGAKDIPRAEFLALLDAGLRS